MRVILTIFKFRCYILVLLKVSKLEINLYWSTRPNFKKETWELQFRILLSLVYISEI